MRSAGNVAFRLAVAGCAALAGIFSLVADDEPGAGPYQEILRRNAFGLQPAPTVAPVTPAPSAADLPEIKLTGMYAQGERVRIYFTKEKRGQQVEFHSGWKGETVGDVELYDANSAQGSAHLRIAGVDLFLSFRGQVASEKAERVAEVKFVDGHTQAHEEFQRRERLREAAEAQAAEAELAAQSK